MRRSAIYWFTCFFIVSLLSLWPACGRAQSPTPTPIPQQLLIVVTATPSAPPTPPTFWGENSQTLIGALIGLIFGGILVWVLKPMFEKAGNTLADALSKLGYGWGFQRRYLTYLIEEYRGLNIRGLKTRAPVTVELEQVYVSLHAQTPDYALGRPAPPALTIGQALAQHPRLAIVGGPGSGKTTLLAYLTLTYARGDVKPRLGLAEDRLPILVPLRQLKRLVEGTPRAPASPSAPGIPAALRARLRAALLDCAAFASDAALRALFADARLALWQDALPVTDSRDDRVRRVIEWLYAQENDAGENALGLLVYVLQDEVTPGDALYQRLGALATELQHANRGHRATASGAATLPADVGSLSDYLTTWYTALKIPPRADFFETHMRQGRCLVLLDGLDEVADETERRLMAAWVDRLVTLYPRNRYIVTSRPPGYESAPLQNGFARLDVRDFDEAEIRRFAENWCLAVELATGGAPVDGQGRAARQQAQALGRRRAAEAARDLTTAISANPAIRALAVNPLLLSIIALVHRYRATLPKRRVDLYAECVDVLLGHWDTAKGLLGKLDAGQKRAVLQSLALTLQGENRRELSRRALAERVAGLLPGVGAPAVGADEFLDEVRERSGLLVEAGLDTYTFSHLTFQEYLAARALVDAEAGRETLLAHVREEWWQEVVLLYVGLTDATPVVTALLADGTCDDAALLLAGRCVAEAVRLAPDAREKVFARLQDAFATCAQDRFLQIGQVLAELAGEDSVGFFLRLAKDAPDRRAASLWALGEMGRQPNDALRGRVLARLLENFETGECQTEAGQALMQIWGARLVVALRQRQVSPAVLEQALNLTMVRIPAGEFLYGDKKQRKTLPEFWIDRTPVTQAQYKQFIDANPDHSVPYINEGGARPYNWDRQTRTYPADKADHPVVLVSWHDAQAYAQWAGKRLPTEEEWEKAARGIDGRKYPWGDAFDEEKCNTSESGIGGTTLVGAYSPQGDSPYGCVDMAGNVWEWMISDWSGTDKDKVLRGGSWGRYEGSVCSASRNWNTSSSCNGDVGSRCVSAGGQD